MAEAVEQEYNLDGTPVGATPDSVDEGVDYPDQDLEELQQVGVAVEWLQDLRYTIARQGVSKGDIQALTDIRVAMEALGVTFDATPSVEAYGVSSFTDDRSGVNLQVATESIGRAMVGLIKGMIRKLVEYINKVVRWLRRAFYSEEIAKTKLDGAVKRLEALRKKNQEFEKAYARNPVLDEKYAEHRETLLAGLTPVTAVIKALLGAHKAQAEVSGVISTIRSLYPIPLILAQQLKTTVLDENSKTTNVSFTAYPMDRMTQLQTVIGIVSKDPNFMQDIPLDTFVARSIEGRVSRTLSELTKTQEVLAAYEQINDVLKHLNRFDRVSEWEGLVEMINDLTHGSEQLSRMFQFLYEYNASKIKVLNALYQYENLRYTLNTSYAREKYVGDAKETAIDAFAKGVEKLMKELTR